MKKLLVTTDLSSEAARPYATVGALADSLGMEITLLHVVEDVALVPPDAPLPPPVTGVPIAERIQQAREQLAEEARRFDGKAPVRFDVACAGDVPRAIAAYAAEHGFDLIALSTHGRSGFRRMVMGSIAETVLRRAHVPVLVFPPPAEG